MTSHADLNEANDGVTEGTGNTTANSTRSDVASNEKQQKEQPEMNITFRIKMSVNEPTTNTMLGALDTVDYDYDSLTDEREKTDTTPENIKKIDDIIERRGATTIEATSSSTASSTPSTAAAASAATTSLLLGGGSGNANYLVGLGAAIDNSNAKLCFAKPTTTRTSQFSNDEDTLNKTNDQSLESSSCEPTETAVNESNNNSINSNIERKNRNSIGEFNEDREDDSFGSNTTNTTTTTNANNKQHALAFTIDHSNDKDKSDPATTEARYKSMLERFQNRHRRGASLSKLESDNDKKTSAPTTPTAAVMITSLTSVTKSNRPTRNNQRCTGDNDTATTADLSKVKLRARDRSTSRMRDASKRHSWSPRSSSNAQENGTINATAATTATTAAASATSKQRRNTNAAIKSKPPLSASATAATAAAATTKGASNLLANRTQQFQPRSTAMQLALQKVDFICPQPPLADFKSSSQLNMNDDNGDEAVSEAGTYTLDGDNYTEEQKDYMNIDRNGVRRGASNERQQIRRPKDLKLSDSTTTITPRRANNVLEVNYYHETPSNEKPAIASTTTATMNASDLMMIGAHQSAGAYLEGIKTRVLRNIEGTSKTSIPQPIALDAKQQLEGIACDTKTDDDDVGCFTSVTTSGVLAKQRALDSHPKLTRRCSLSTSQIDASEFVSNEMKLKQSNAYNAIGGFTDHQKAEYRLNFFTNQKDSKFSATRSMIATPPETPSSQTSLKELSDTAVLKTAQSKQDWIQEWARNARARSLANETQPKQHKQRHSAGTQALMTRSYNCSDTGGESLTDDSIYNQQQFAAKLNQTLAERYRLIGTVGENDYSSSDPVLHKQDTHFKPPKSPSKIPSPLHTLGRARSACRTSLTSNGGEMSAEMYLQKTAAAINSLQQSLTRKTVNMKSPTHSASPRAGVRYSPTQDDDGGIVSSPQHSLESPTTGSYHYSPRHRRHQNNDFSYGRHGSGNARDQLMTSSINEAQLQLLINGDYLVKQMNRRKNSFDGGNVATGNSPQKQQVYGSQRTPQRGTEPLSPLRRSSSFSSQQLVGNQQQQHLQKPRQARPQFQNIYTPPAARHTLSAATRTTNAIQKSASSNNCRQIYSDYDDNLQYYINDEDEVCAGDYYSSEEDDYTKDVEQQNVIDEYYQRSDDNAKAATTNDSVPLSNTRLNKALLMRIERSKQKISGSAGAGGAGIRGDTQNKSNPASKSSQNAAITGHGLIACPNTPELPRRNIKSAPQRTPRSNAGGNPRQSMPRDASLSRLANQVPSSLACAKKQLLQAAYGGQLATKNHNSNSSNAKQTSQRVQPKYLDISKYKPAQPNNFLRKCDAKTTNTNSPLNDQMKRSPSTSSMSRNDPTRASNRSTRSISTGMNTSMNSCGSSAVRGSSMTRRDASMNKQKEAEMAMWKRRSTYDPMKAAAEDRRRKDEAKRVALAKQNEMLDTQQFESQMSEEHSFEQEDWIHDESAEEYATSDDNVFEQQQQEQLEVEEENPSQ